MTWWGRATVPVAAAAVALFVARVLEPITDRAWAPAILPAIVVGTWAAGWPGGLIALAIGFAGRIFLIAPYPWARPGWMTSWLVVHIMAIVVTEVGRHTRHERLEARRVQREQAARAAKAVAARRAEFLAHASDVLASSPDYQTTLTAVANLAVPQIADLCIVDIVNEQGEFTPLAVAHVDPSKVELVRELRRMYPLDLKAPYGPPRVLRTGRSQIYSQLPDIATAETSIDPSALRVALALGIHSTMAVPLLVAGRRLGIISLATTDSGRRFVDADVQFAEDLARRAAIAIDTAHP
jgi:GAF domain-containing protein